MLTSDIKRSTQRVESALTKSSILPPSQIRTKAVSEAIHKIAKAAAKKTSKSRTSSKKKSKSPGSYKQRYSRCLNRKRSTVAKEARSKNVDYRCPTRATMCRSIVRRSSKSKK